MNHVYSSPNSFPLFHSGTCCLFLFLFLFQSLFNCDSIIINNMNTDTLADSRSKTSFTDFLNRMHHPASLDLVRSIKRQPPLSLYFPFFIFSCSISMLMLHISSTLFMHSEVLRETSLCLLLVLLSLLRSPHCIAFNLPFMSSIIQYYYQYCVL